MDHRFTTILDVYAPDGPPDRSQLRRACARWRAATEQDEVPETVRSLTSPTLLSGLCMAGIGYEEETCVVSLTISRAVPGDLQNLLWGGPVRICFESVHTIVAASGDVASIAPNDPVVWNELHAPAAERGGMVLLLRFRSGNRLRIEAGSIGFCRVGLPC